MTGGKKNTAPRDLAGLLREKGVGSVLFIDDGFDPLSDHEPTDDEQDAIWAAVQADTAAMAAADELGASDEGWFNAAEVERVLALDEGDALRRVVEAWSYVTEHRDKAKLLKAAMDYLASVGVGVKKAGKQDWRDHVPGSQIVFLDWRLGPDEEEQSVRNAVEAARLIQAQQPKPFLVLVSSDPGVKARAQEFSEASGLVGGMFDAMPKQWLSDRLGVDVNLSILLQLYSAGDTVQSFVDALRQEASLAVGRFLERVSKLTVSDYANLQHFALRNDGHPLGDYLVELLSGLWADALFQGPLRTQLLAMSRVDFDTLPALTGPSEALVDLHNGAVFDMHVGPLAPHPHQEGGGGASRPMLSLGDVVVKRADGRTTEVHVVLNPQCDLAQSPRTKRSVPDDQSILLVPGDIAAVDHAERKKRRDLGDTPLFRVGSDAPLRVHWAAKKLKTVPYASLPSWMSEGRDRVARMRTLYALALQRQVSSELTRVGVPAPPPIYGPVQGVLARYRASRQVGQDVAVAQGRLVMARDEKGDTIVLDHPFVRELSRCISDDIEGWATDREAKVKPDDERHREAIREALRNVDDWVKLCKPFGLNDDGARFFAGSLLVCRKRPNGVDRKILACLVLDLDGATAPADAAAPGTPDGV